MVYPNVYNKLKVIAEMQESWDQPSQVVSRLIREGYYTEVKNVHPDRLKTVMHQIEFMKEIKKILLSGSIDS